MNVKRNICLLFTCLICLQTLASAAEETSYSDWYNTGYEFGFDQGFGYPRFNSFFYAKQAATDAGFLDAFMQGYNDGLSEGLLSRTKLLVNYDVQNVEEKQALFAKLDKTGDYLRADKTKKALNELNAFVNRVTFLKESSTDSYEIQNLSLIIEKANQLIYHIEQTN